MAIPISQTDLVSETAPEASPKSGFGLVWMIAAGVVVAAVIGAVLILLKMRSRRSKVEPLLENTPDE